MPCRGAAPRGNGHGDLTVGPGNPGHGATAPPPARQQPALRAPVHGTTACSTAAHSSSTTSLREYELDQVHRV
ncbi:hypothetical protein FM106_23210 [Brachybacterium faecium]|nr:hypothetical protein FM106_23210 [Brachybacterium faecium]